MKRIIFLIGLMLGLVSLFVMAVPIQGASEISHGPRISQGTDYSINWSGYAIATGAGGVTDVKGSWVVPAVQPSNGRSYSSAWVGIDGDTSNSVEQIGTEQDYVSGAASYYAWYEMYPQYPVNLDNKSYPVKPGDSMSAEVKYNGSGSFTLTLADAMKAGGTWSYTTIQTYSAAQCSSAEWIMEAPSMGTVLPLANFGTINFSNSQATINGSPVTITNSNADKITMVTRGGITKALPSDISTPGSFSVTWQHK